MMIPYADLANHHNSDTQYEMFNPDIHFSNDVEEWTKAYKTKCKMMINFSDFDTSKKEEISGFQKNHFYRCEAYQSLWKFKWDAWD